MTRQETYTNS